MPTFQRLSGCMCVAFAINIFKKKHLNKRTVLVHMASVNTISNNGLYSIQQQKKKHIHTISTSNSSFIASFECLSVCIKRIALQESEFTLWWELEEKMPKHIHIPFITCVKGLMINYNYISKSVTLVSDQI